MTSSVLIQNESIEEDNSSKEIEKPTMSSETKRHVKESSLSQSWFVYLNLALTFGAFAALYFYLPAKRDCAYLHDFNDTQLATPAIQRNGDTWHKIIVVTDLDHDSKHPEKKDTCSSFMKRGVLKISADQQKATVEWDDEHEILLFSQLAAAGRSMELSDLKSFDGRLLSVDDRTGIIYAINRKFEAIPWVLLNDGPGNVTKGFKGEWIASKDRHLYVGGLGKEWTTVTGDFVNNNPMWIKIVGPGGDVQHVDWTKQYKALRSAVGIEYPGYMIHESGQYSEIHKKWFFMPRRASKDTYNEADDEKRGTNLLLTADDTFSQIDVHHVGSNGEGSRGYSAFQFIPNTADDLIVALKSEEFEGKPVASYLTVFRLSDGHILLNESKLKGAHKYEGVEFADF